MPMHAMHQTLHAVQGKVGTLERAAGPAAEPTFGPALSDLIDANPHCATTVVAIKRLHDGSALRHLSNVVRAAEALRKQVHELLPEHKGKTLLGPICSAVVRDCDKCIDNRAKHEAKEEDVRRQRAASESAPSEYRVADCRRDESLPRTYCQVCNRGHRDDIPDGESLIF
jgi:hypothetical protein